MFMSQVKLSKTACGRSLSCQQKERKYTCQSNGVLSQCEGVSLGYVYFFFITLLIS